MFPIDVFKLRFFNYLFLNVSGLEYESGDAVAWITEVVAEGENRLRLLRKQLEAAQRQLDVTPKPITDEG